MSSFARKLCVDISCRDYFIYNDIYMKLVTVVKRTGKRNTSDAFGGVLHTASLKLVQVQKVNWTVERAKRERSSSFFQQPISAKP